jgi:hypothetical protein
MQQPEQLRRRIETESALVTAIKDPRSFQIGSSTPATTQARQERIARSVLRILKLPEDRRAGQNQRLIVVGPRHNGRLELSDSLYQVYAAEKIRPANRSPFVHFTLRDILFQYAPWHSTDAAVLAEKDIRDETSVERQRRLIREIRLLDKIIAITVSTQSALAQKNRPSEQYINMLNNQKIDRILDYVETAAEVKKRYGLDDTVGVKDDQDNNRVVIYMKQHREINIWNRLTGGEQSSFASEVETTTINLNRRRLRERVERAAGSQDPYDKITAELCVLLRLQF